MLLFLLFLGSERCKFEKWPADNAQKMTLFRCWMSDGWVWRSSVPPVTSVEINKHKIFDANNESLNYSFRNKKNVIWVIYRIKQLRNKKNHGVLRGPQLGKQRWRARLGILRVNGASSVPEQRPRLFKNRKYLFIVLSTLQPESPSLYGGYVKGQTTDE